MLLNSNLKSSQAMKIDKEQLVELLVKKTGMDQEEVEGQLNELIQRITSAAERGKALEIKGFGLFYFDDDGNLKFDPADEFSTEVNFKYAGMQPVELKPARESSKGGDDEPDDEDDIFGIEDELIEEDEQKEKKDEPADPIFGDTEDDEDEEDDDDDPFGSLLSGPASEFKEQEEKEIQKAGTAPKSSPKAKKEDKKEKKKAKSAKKSPDQPAKKKSSPKKKEKKKDPMVTVIAVIIGVVILVGGYFIYDEMSTTPVEPQTTQQPQVETEEPPVTAETDVTEAEPESSDEVEESVAEEPEDVEATTDPSEPYGLEGDIVDSANDGFTIVLHSMRNEQAARSAADQLSNAGYRSMVTERDVDGSTVYRVGVGQFPSIPDAQEAAKELPSPFNTENFIQRIRN